MQKQPSLPEDYNREFWVGNEAWTAELPRHTDSLYDTADFRSHAEGSPETFAHGQTRVNFAVTPLTYYILLYPLSSLLTSAQIDFCD